VRAIFTLKTTSENHVSSEEFTKTTSMTLPPINIIRQKTSSILEATVAIFHQLKNIC
jgi:hypothetical protein